MDRSIKPTSSSLLLSPKLAKSSAGRCKQEAGYSHCCLNLYTTVEEQGLGWTRRGHARKATGRGTWKKPKKKEAEKD